MRQKLQRLKRVGKPSKPATRLNIQSITQTGILDFLGIYTAVVHGSPATDASRSSQALLSIIEQYLRGLNPFQLHDRLDWHTVRFYRSLPLYVHPTLNIKKFDSSLWAGDYECIYPALQLATAMLMNTKQLRFWHGMLKAGTSRSKQSGLLLEPTPDPVFEAQPQLSEDEIDSTRSFLESLAERVSFCCDAGSPEIQGCEGACNYVDETGVEDGPGAVCCRSVIYFRPLLIDMAKKRVAQRNESALRVIYFRLAVVFLHELTHAAVHELFGPRKRAYFQDEPTSEVGFAYENYMFGGVPRWRHADLYLRNWPSRYLQDDYTKSDCLFGVRDQIVDEDMLWLVNAESIDRFYCVDFWRQGIDIAHPFRLSQLTEIATK